MTAQPISTANVFRLTSMTRSSSAIRKLALPVDRNLLLYSRFKHVHGTPSPAKGEGLPLYNLRALDNLIARLISIKGKNSHSINVDGMGKEEIATLTQRLQEEVHSLVSGSQASLLAGSETNDVGLILDLVA